MDWKERNKTSKFTICLFRFIYYKRLHYLSPYLTLLFRRVIFGERLESEEMHNVKVSGSRGSREMTFVVGNVCLLIFNLIRVKQYRNIFFILLLSFYLYRENDPRKQNIIGRNTTYYALQEIFSRRNINL